ncbi:hypothetical protein [Nocardiopsis alba]|uniref:hypothetical protein n=1 Tax=Nocardiopsis alba TaxID=53437 RepID=UPI003D72E3B7
MARHRVRVEIQVDTEWVDITRDVYTREDISITRGRADEGQDVDPGKCSFVLNNRDGRYSPRNPRSPYYGLLGRNTPIRLSVVLDGRVYPRFCGEVSAWPPKWDLSGKDVYVTVEASGILRRLNGSVNALESALRRFIVAEGPRAYWPLTDGVNTQNAAAERGGNITYTFNRTGDLDAPMAWASGDIASWLEPVATTPDKAPSGEFRGYVRGNNRPDSWAVDFVRMGRGGSDAFRVEVGGAGTDADPMVWWELGFNPTTRQLSVLIRTTGATSSSLGSVVQPWAQARAFDDDVAHVFRFQVVRVTASSVRWTVYMDGVQLRTGTWSAIPRGVVRWYYDWFHPDGGDAGPVSLGHITVWDAAIAPDPLILQLAYHGHAGETAGARIERVCTEAGIPVAFVGDPDDTQLVGPQELGTPLDVLNSAARVDGGILYEDRESARLVYRTNRSRYNRGYLLPEDN